MNEHAYPRRTSHIGPVAVAAAAVRTLHGSASDARIRMAESAQRAHTARRANFTEPPGPTSTARPQLTASNAVEYIDWALSNAPALVNTKTLDAHLRGAELVVRMHMAEAQAKDTQHTLVRDGVIDPPPAAA